MTWHLNIPKILHVYWGGGHLVYLRYLTVKSFMKYNPDWQVFLWYPIKPYRGKSWGGTGQELMNPKLCKDYFPELMNMTISKIPMDFYSLGFGDSVSEVHKADYIRINSLNIYGGVWSDLDIIYFKPIESLRVNVPENKTKEVFVCVGPYGHSTGFNMATEGSKFFSMLVNKFNTEYKSNNYQCWGPDMFNKYFKHVSDIPNVVNMSMDVVYAHDCHSVAELLNGNDSKFNDESIGCHWYAGNALWGDFFNQTGGGERNLPDNLISKLINGV